MPLPFNVCSVIIHFYFLWFDIFFFRQNNFKDSPFELYPVKDRRNKDNPSPPQKACPVQILISCFLAACDFGRYNFAEDNLFS